VSPATTVTVAVGVTVLLFGRRLFWLFVAAVGFAVGLHWATLAFPRQPDWVAVLIALAAAGVGALLAVSLQVLAVAVGGFLAGVYAALAATKVFPALAALPVWVLALVAGVVGAVLLLWMWDWALVVLSALTGAALLAPLPRLDPALTGLLFVVLLAIGLVVQATQLARQSKVSRVSTARRS
jgi:Domain of unknown function (DUF4203)